MDSVQLGKRQKIQYDECYGVRIQGRGEIDEEIGAVGGRGVREPLARVS